MKKILLILIFIFSSAGYSITFYADEDFIKKKFHYDKKLDSYVFNKNKLNTLSFNTLKVEDDLFVIQTIIKLDEQTDVLKEIKFNNKSYSFAISNIDLVYADNALVFISLSNIDNDDLYKIIEFFIEGNVYLEYITENNTYKYKINNKTSKIFAEILKHSLEINKN